jgi:hypothetical protein
MANRETDFIDFPASCVIIAIAAPRHCQLGARTVFGSDLNKLFPLGQVTAAWQLLELVFTLAIAIVGGLTLGGLLALCTSPKKRLFSDDAHWRVPADYEAFVDEDEK